MGGVGFCPMIPWVDGHVPFEFFTSGESDVFLSDYLTDLKLHSTK